MKNSYPGVDGHVATNSDVVYHVTPTRNVVSILPEGLLPRIGLRSQLRSEAKPKVRFFSSLEGIENLHTDWPGEEPGFLTVPAVDPSAIQLDPCTVIEHSCLTTISPEKISPAFLDDRNWDAERHSSSKETR